MSAQSRVEDQRTPGKVVSEPRDAVLIARSLVEWRTGVVLRAE